MKKLAAALLVVTSLSGCFTAAGAAIGSGIEAGSPETHAEATETGTLIGVALDAVTVALLLSGAGSDPNSCFTYGPGEGGGVCGEN
jgi:predicted small secreted protein